MNSQIQKKLLMVVKKAVILKKYRISAGMNQNLIGITLTGILIASFMCVGV